jgi:hypothetical protein
MMMTNEEIFCIRYPNKKIVEDTLCGESYKIDFNSRTVSRIIKDGNLNDRIKVLMQHGWKIDKNAQGEIMANGEF